jgi:hypothetical protein
MDDLVQSLRVYAAPHRKTRLGKDNDGGYIDCPLDDYDCFLSGRIGDDLSFEADVLRGRPTSCAMYWTGRSRSFW